jgi:hypothetical protein
LAKALFVVSLIFTLTEGNFLCFAHRGLPDIVAPVSAGNLKERPQAFSGLASFGAQRITISVFVNPLRSSWSTGRRRQTSARLGVNRTEVIQNASAAYCSGDAFLMSLRYT